MVLEVVATLGGAVLSTPGGAAIATLGGAVIVTLGGATFVTLGIGVAAGSASGWPDMILVSRRIVSMCFILFSANVGTVPPICVRKSFAASSVLLCSEMTGTWQWLG
jgi:hypothetical protein